MNIGGLYLLHVSTQPPLLLGFLHQFQSYRSASETRTLLFTGIFKY